MPSRKIWELKNSEMKTRPRIVKPRDKLECVFLVGEKACGKELGVRGSKRYCFLHRREGVSLDKKDSTLAHRADREQALAEIEAPKTRTCKSIDCEEVVVGVKGKRYCSTECRAENTKKVNAKHREEYWRKKREYKGDTRHGEVVVIQESNTELRQQTDFFK